MPTAPIAVVTEPAITQADLERVRLRVQKALLEQIESAAKGREWHEERNNSRLLALAAALDATAACRE